MDANLISIYKNYIFRGLQKNNFHRYGSFYPYDRATVRAAFCIPVANIIGKQQLRCMGKKLPLIGSKQTRAKPIR
jgi:hypothetical protein